MLTFSISQQLRSNPAMVLIDLEMPFLEMQSINQLHFQELLQFDY
jgi:hypothetical protein